MQFEIRITLSVDSDANFIEADALETSRVIKDLVETAIYDIDDVIIEECEVEEC